MVRVTDIHFNIRCSQQFFFWDEDFLGKEEPGIDINTFKGEFKGEPTIRKSFDACNRCVDGSEKEDGWNHSEKTKLGKVDQSMREEKEKLKEYTRCKD